MPEEADRDFVAGAFLERDGKILFLKHKKYGIWLQPGGHVEEDETPDEAAVREMKEETGLEVEVVGEEKEFESYSATDLPMPFNINLHQIEESHWHCDFQYEVRKVGDTEEYEYPDEKIRWLSKEEIRSDSFEMPANVRRSALELLENRDE